MLEHFGRASMPRLSGATAPQLENAPSRRGRRSHGRLSYDANHLIHFSQTIG